MIELKKLTIVKCYECGKSLAMTCLCRGCASKQIKTDNYKVYEKRNADRRG